jgi:hypothetical protein
MKDLNDVEHLIEALGLVVVARQAVEHEGVEFGKQ